MQNRTVGYILIALALLIGSIIYMFNRALSDIVNETCSHGPSCPMWGSINFQTSVSVLIMVVIVIVGLFLIFFGDKETHKPKKYENGLTSDEKKLLKYVKDKDGTIFQSELVDKTGYTKVKVTRILDRLEGKSLIERRRRGMTNVVILK